MPISNPSTAKSHSPVQIGVAKPPSQAPTPLEVAHQKALRLAKIAKEAGLVVNVDALGRGQIIGTDLSALERFARMWDERG